MKILLVSVALFSLAAAADEAPARLVHSRDCILRAVSQKMGITLRAEVPLPPVFVASETPLQQFQDAIEAQWGFRPDLIANAYAARTNEIYLLDSAAYYRKHGRFIDDSLAHELVHYLQVRYQNADIRDGEWLEADAVMVQTWFREEIMAKGLSPCPGQEAGIPRFFPIFPK